MVILLKSPLFVDCCHLHLYNIISPLSSSIPLDRFLDKESTGMSSWVGFRLLNLYLNDLDFGLFNILLKKHCSLLIGKKVRRIFLFNFNQAYLWRDSWISSRQVSLHGLLKVWFTCIRKFSTARYLFHFIESLLTFFLKLLLVIDCSFVHHS